MTEPQKVGRFKRPLKVEGSVEEVTDINFVWLAKVLRVGGQTGKAKPGVARVAIAVSIVGRVVDGFARATLIDEGGTGVAELLWMGSHG